MTDQLHQNARLGAAYTVVGPVPEARAEEALVLRVRVQNTGAAPWSHRGAYPVNLSYHWLNEHGQVVDFEGLRAIMPGPLRPGESVELELQVEPPPGPGRYQLVLDMVEEGVGWFTLQGVVGLPIPMTVAPAPQDAPRVCIVNGNCTANDAVGNHVLNQLRYFQARGYQAMVLVEHIDTRLPAEVRRHLGRISLDELREGSSNPQVRRALNHFRTADLYVFNYSTFYRLAEAIRLVDHGVVIFDYHGITPPHLWEGAGVETLIEGQRRLDLVRYADYAIGHSAVTCAELIKTGAIAPQRVFQMGYAVPLGNFRPGPKPEALLARYGLRPEQPVLLYVGRMAANKRIEVLIRALAIMRERLPDAVLLLVGDDRTPPYAQVVEQARRLAAALGVAEGVIFSGQVPDAELGDHYRLADLFVTASLHEGFCIPVVEAMACGMPVVGAHATALPETIGEGGLTFRPDDPADLAHNVESIISPIRTLKMTIDNGQDNLPQRIGFVVPRYGVDVVGGAERHIRDWAEQLHRRGYQVEVFTTCTNDMLDWNNHYPPGTEVINGVPVHRFVTDSVDIGQVHRTASKALGGIPVSYHEQVEFVRHSVNSQALYQHLRDHQDEFRCFIFAPYLFGTTYWGVLAVPDKALLLPCLHDEPFARFATYRELLETARGVMFSTEAERRLAIQQLGMANPCTALVGYGFDPHTPPGDAARFRQKHRLPPELLLYVGRLQAGKNVPLLIDYFVRYKSERPGPLTLALGGEGEVIQLARPDVVELGFLSEEEKNDAFAAATVFCLPSLNESFSIVIMESWLQGTPVLVHGKCAVTSEHVQRSGGGWTFTSYEEFRAALDQALGDRAGRDARGNRGRAYVVQEYNWDAVIARLLDAIERFTQPLSLRDQLARRGIRRALAFSLPRFEESLTQVVARAEADLAQGLTHSQVDRLRQAAHVTMPEYQVHSNAPLVGDLIATVRRNLTSHLREPYLDPILEKQEAYNKLLIDTLVPALERSLRAQQRLERQVRLLEQQLAQVRAAQEEQQQTV